MKLIKDWPGLDEKYTDEERVITFKDLLLTRRRLAKYCETGISQAAVGAIKSRDRNAEGIKQLERKIEYYSSNVEDREDINREPIDSVGVIISDLFRYLRSIFGRN